MKTHESGADTNVLGKTPGEIKKCLGRCLDRWTPIHFESCESDCPYHSEGALCKETLHLDVLTYIQRLEETISSLGHLNKTMYDEAKNGIQELESRLAQVERERDAAVKIIEDATTYLEDFGSGRFALMQLKKWNGPRPENTKEE